MLIICINERKAFEFIERFIFVDNFGFYKVITYGFLIL